MSKEMVNTSIRMDKELKEKLELMAEKDRTSMSSVILKAVDEYLKVRELVDQLEPAELMEIIKKMKGEEK